MIYSGTADESFAQTAQRLADYNRAKDAVFQQWLNNKKFKELISCAHGRWYPYEEFTLPLAQYFADQQDLAHLKFLCEHEIRFRLEDMLNCLKRVKEYDAKLTHSQILEYGLSHLDPEKYHPILELFKWRDKALHRLEVYLELLKDQSDQEYKELIKQLKQKLLQLNIKKSDLKLIKFKLY
ncbi:MULTISPECIES: hypothetical protein [unclassified Acinetobacter]|nr:MULTISPECIES: hypothetical protein [unclassified Acinetobacter]MBJ9954793.1 hypothetical protein [Acinetobacter baumannii]